MEENYFIAVNGNSQGPYSKDVLKTLSIKPDTLVWRPGLSGWVKAADLPEIADILTPQNPYRNYSYTQREDKKEWYAMTQAGRIGPLTLAELINNGIDSSTPLWKPGMNDWETAGNIPEYNDIMNPKNSVPPFRNNNDYGYNPNPGNRYYNPNNFGNQYPGNNYNTQNQYGNPGNNYSSQNPYDPYRREMPTNWLPWAIVATIIGFFFSCIGAIFGIIGIIQANKANNFFAANNYQEGNRVNSNAKTMTIIGFVLAGFGILIGLISGFSILNFY